MPRTRTADSLVKDAQGFVTATIFSIEDTHSSYSGDQFKWTFTVTTAKGKTSTKPYWTGVSFNPNKTYIDPETGELGYNKLTTICLNLGVITEEQLLNKEELEMDLDELLLEKTVKFKTKPSQRRASLEEIDISSIRVMG